MTKMRKQAVVIASVLVMVICALLGIFLMFPPKHKSAEAMLEINSTNKNTYLNITGSGNNKTLSGFKQTPTEPFTLEIPNDVTVITDGAFRNSNVVSITYQARANSVSLQIGNEPSPGTPGDSVGVFSNCTSLTSVSLPDSTTIIGPLTFDGCTALTSIDVPANAGNVGYGTYRGCKALTTVNFKTTSKFEIYAQAFSGCTSLATINTENASRIQSPTFVDCYMLSHIDLSGITYSNLPDETFQNCYRLADVKKPSSKTVNCALTYALNSYTTSNGSRLVKIKEDNGNGYFVFAQKTSNGTSRYLATSGNYNNTGTNSDQKVSTAWGFNHTNDRWYLVSYEGDVNDGGYNTYEPMDFPTAEELRAAASAQLGLSGNASSYEYDINTYAFYQIHAHNVKIPSFVNVIGNDAFNMSTLRVLDLEGASALKYVGYHGFTNNGNFIAYMPDRQLYGDTKPSTTDRGATNEVIWFGTGVSATPPTTIVAPSYAAYNALTSSTHSYWGDFTDVLTYRVPINLHYSTAKGGTSSDRYDTQYRLWKKTYNFVEQEGSRLLDYDLSMSLPIQEGYSVSVWYNSATNQTSSTRVNEAGLNALLGNEFLYSGSIDLYARAERKPGNILPEDECNINVAKYTYDGVSYGLGVSDINKMLSDHGSSAQLSSIMEAEIVEYIYASGAVHSSPDRLTQIRDAGAYKISVKLNTAYGTWEEPALITVNIEQKEIDLSLFDNHKFQLDYGRNLAGGTLYFDEGSDIPYQEQFDSEGKERNALRVENSYVRNNEAAQAIELMDLVGAVEGSRFVYSVISNNNPPTKIPELPGSYSTVFNLSLIYDEGGVHYDYSNNYSFVDKGSSTSAELAERGVQIIPANYSATIIKVWYIVEVDNYFTKTRPSGEGQDTDSYSVRSWVYGLGSPAAPFINYGDENRIRFTLRYTSAANGFDREVIAAGTNYDTATAYSKFANCVNSSMPVGRYELGLYYPVVWARNSDGYCVYEKPADDIINDYKIHYECYTIYSFEVTAAPLDDSRVAAKVNAIKNKLDNDVTFNFDYDGKVHFLDQESRNAVDDLTNLNVTTERKGVWATGAYDKCFGGFQIAYNLERTQSNQYFAEGSFSGVSPIDPDNYIIYYQLSAPNWQSLVNPNTDDTSDPAYRRNYYYTVVITKFVEAPTVSSVTYTGSAVSPYITYHDNNAVTTVSWGDSEYVTGGKHTVTFRLSDYPYYYFKDAEGNKTRTITVEFTISAVQNSWALQPVINGWTFGETANGVNSGAYYGTVVYKYYAGTYTGQPDQEPPATATAYNDFEALVNANSTDGHLNAGSYYIWAYVTGNADYTKLSHICTFTVAKRSVSVPSMPQVTYNGQAHNLSVADGENYTASSAIAVVYAGTYNIDVTLKDSNNYQWLKGSTVLTGATTQVEFVVNTAQNSWVQSPSAISWHWNQYDRKINLFSAQPKYWQKDGTVQNIEQSVTWYIYDNAHKIVEGFEDGFTLELVEGKWVVPAGIATVLNNLDAGTWYLSAVVSDGYNEGNTGKAQKDFGGLGAGNYVPFVILVASNNWVVSPTVRNWNYGGYGDGTSITAAEPVNGKGTVSYIISGNGQNNLPVTLNADSTVSTTALLGQLNTLPAGDYKLTVSVPGVANQYSVFSQEYNFTISKASNAITATITGWTYGSTDVASKITVNYPSKTAGSTETYTLYSSGEVKGTYTSLNAFVTAMTTDGALPDAGDYSVSISVAEGTNYQAGYTAGSVTFTIAPAQNRWSTVPAITVGGTSKTQWAYGNTATLVYEAEHKGGVPSVSYYSAVKNGNSYVKGDALEVTSLPANVGVYCVSVGYTGVKNYAPLSSEIFFEITKGTNGYTVNPVVQGFTYGQNATYTAPASTFTTDITVIIDNNGTAMTWPEAVTELGKLGAGNHSFRVTLAATDNFDAVSTTVNFTIAKASLKWDTGMEPSVIGTEFTGWYWGTYADENANINNVLSNGTAVNDGGNASASVTSSYVISSGGNTYTLDSLRNANVGTYTVTFTATKANFNDLVKTITFEIKQNPNGWKSEPGTGSSYEWDFGTKTNGPSTIFGTAGSNFGTVNISYKTKDGNATYNDLPTEVGEYYIVYTVTGTTNYAGLSKEVPFKINGSSLTAWAVGFGVSSYWTWNNYDRDTHIFRGVAESGGKVSYAIFLGEEDKTPYFELEDDGKVPEDIEKLLNGLEAGDYTLKVKVAANSGYNAFEDTLQDPIKISPAKNSWTVSPSIAPWVVGEWRGATEGSVGNVPQGLAKYGETRLTIYRLNDNGEMDAGRYYYLATRQTVIENGEPTVKLTVTTNEFYGSIDGTLSGSYALVIEVQAEANQYEGIKETVYFQIFSSSKDIQANYWFEIPSIDNWTAGDKPSVPKGQPLRDAQDKPTLTYTYYVLKFNDLKSEWEVEDEIAFENITKAGRYRMVVEVFGENPNHRDHLKQEIDFSVDKRINNWEISPSIENWFLSGTPSKPVYETTQESEVTITYQRIDIVNAPILTELPTEAGEYRMYVKAIADNCDDLDISYDFKVMLSTNTWEKIPSIENWSEEFDPNNPTAEAAFGEVVYTYFTKDGKPLDERPTTEGTYIMRATVEAEGYAPLVEEVEFTIEPAFDMTFILIDTALAAVAAILTIVLISVIVRRKNK